MTAFTIEQFLDYVSAFNAHDYKRQHSYYHPQVDLLIPDPRIGLLKGSEGIMAHYVPLHSNYEEVLVPMEIMINERRVFFIMETYFRSKRAIKAGTAGFDYEAGDIARVVVWALYDIEDEKMRHITCNLLKADFIGQKTKLEDLIKESHSRAAPGLKVN